MGTQHIFGRKSFILVLGLGLGLSAVSTTFFMRPFPETVSDAPTIVRGTIGKSQAKWANGEDGSQRIYTYSELQVREVFKGSVEGGSLSFREMGGEVNGLGFQIAGTAQFSQGEDVVVFLGLKNTDGSYDLRGMSHGKLNIQSAGGKEILVGAALGTAPEGGHDHAHHQGQDGSGDHARTWSLSDLRELVKSQAVAENDKQINKNKEMAVPSPLASFGAPALQNTEGSGGGKEGLPIDNSSPPTIPWGTLFGVVLGLGILGGLGFFFFGKFRA